MTQDPVRLDVPSTNRQTVTSQSSGIPLETSFFNQKYLFAFTTQPELRAYITREALPEEEARFPEILKTWEAIQPRVQKLIGEEAGLAEAISIEEVPAKYLPKLESFAADPLFQKSFAELPTSFAVIDIDKLVAGQRAVNLDYVQRLESSLPESLELDGLLDICASPKRKMEPIQHLQIAPHTHVFSSPNADVRFLGSFFKPLTEEDFKHAGVGGLPAAAIISFIGYGHAPISVWNAGNRLILTNGFHRAYALRNKGITKIPVVIQLLRNPDLEFPAQFLNLPKEYLLRHPRPVLFKDFFEPGFCISLKIRKRIRMITIAPGLNQHDVPS